jgi:hypothetical protein
LVTPEVLPANIDQDVARISWKKKRSVLPEYVVAYLNSRYGQDHIARQASGMVQQGLPLQKVRCIPVPLLPETIQHLIADTVQAALMERRDAQARLVLAEQVLLGALGLEGWQAQEPLSYTRRASAVFADTRLDAAYFAPHVSDLLAHLGKDRATVGEVAPPRHEQFIRGSGPEFDYIEISGIQNYGTAIAKRLPEHEAPSRAKWYVRSGDIITSTVRPIRRLSAVVTPEQDGFVCSSGFIVLRPKAISSELLLTYLRLSPVCELMNLHTSASMYPAISERDLLALPFPNVSENTEKEIIQMVRRAHAARRVASSHLERVERIVEITIERGEIAATNYFDKKSE